MKQVHKRNIIEYPMIQVTQGITEPQVEYHIQKLLMVLLQTHLYFYKITP